MTPKIIINEFCLRQTADSKFSHFTSSWETLAALAEVNFEYAKKGYRKGVLLIPVPAEGFFSGVVKLAPDVEIIASYAPRRPGEDHFVQLTAKGEKSPALFVDLVVYDKAALGKDASVVRADWEVVSINARTVAVEPQTPMAMARNILGRVGGSEVVEGDYSAKGFAESILYWNQHALKA
jgi:hypothetical protein